MRAIRGAVHASSRPAPPSTSSQHADTDAALSRAKELSSPRDLTPFDAH
jgi:hypothetical protein